MMKRKVLVIDDDEAILEAMQELLTMEGYEVYALSTGVRVEQVLRYFTPDVILLDNLLPRKTGTEICLELKANPLYQHIPVILFSAAQNVAEVSKKAQADDFIAKPFDMDHLLQCIQHNLKTQPST